MAGVIISIWLTFCIRVLTIVCGIWLAVQWGII